jgi:hypothetical protein
MDMELTAIMLILLIEKAIKIGSEIFFKTLVINSTFFSQKFLIITNNLTQSFVI